MLKEKNKENMKPVAWYCPVCGKFDLANTEELLAKPEHISYRGIDIGSCDGDMIPLYALSCPTWEEDVSTNQT